MLKWIAGIIVALLALAAPALAQAPFVRVSPTVTLAVTSSSATVAIGTSTRISTLWICNTGSNDAYIFFGDSTVVADTTGTILRSGVCGNISPDGKTNLAAVTASSTTTLVITPGAGVLYGTGGGGSGGGGGGAVTIANGADVTLGNNTDAASCASGTSLIACERLLHTDLATTLLNAIQAPPGLGTSGGATPVELIGLTNTAGGVQIKAAAGQLFGAMCDNQNNNWVWVPIFDSLTPVLGTTTPKVTIKLPPNLPGGMTISLVGAQFTAAMFTDAVTGGPKGTGAPGTAINCTFIWN